MRILIMWNKKNMRNEYFKNNLVQKRNWILSSFKLKVFKDYLLRKEMYNFKKITNGALIISIFKNKRVLLFIIFLE